MEFDNRINDEELLMTVEFVQGISAEVFKTVIMVAGPALLVSLLVGLMVGFFQTITQIQEFTLTFVPKILAVFTCIFLLMPWLSGKILNFTSNLISQIPHYIR
jgi:flagellar biosynthetic protein FliQ